MDVGRISALAFAAFMTVGAAPSYTLGPNSFRDLYWQSPATYPALVRFIGNHAARYTGYTVPQWSIPEQVSDAMSVPGDDTLLLGDSARVIWGSRHHSADEKGAVVVSRDNELRAVGLINFHCRFVSRADRNQRSARRKDTCDDGQPTLTVFLRGDGAYREALEAWSQHATGKTLRTEVVFVDPKAPPPRRLKH